MADVEANVSEPSLPGSLTLASTQNLPESFNPHPHLQQSAFSQPSLVAGMFQRFSFG